MKGNQTDDFRIQPSAFVSGGGDVVTRAGVDDHLDLTDQHRDLFLSQAVTHAYSG